MSAFDHKAGGVPRGFLDGLLFFIDGGRGLDRHAERDFIPVADAAEDAACVVRCKAFRCNGIVVFTAPFFSGTEPGADLQPLDSADGEHGVCQKGIELVEHRLAETGGKTGDLRIDRAADAVQILRGAFDDSRHGIRRRGIAAADRILFHGGPVDLMDVAGNIADTCGTRPDVDPVMFQQQFRHGTRRHPAGGLSAGGSAAAPVIPEAEFLIKSDVCMTGPVSRSDP